MQDTVTVEAALESVLRMIEELEADIRCAENMQA